MTIQGDPEKTSLQGIQVPLILYNFVTMSHKCKIQMDLLHIWQV